MYHSILFVTVISLTSTYATPSRSILAGNRIVGPMAKNSGFFRSRKILGGSRRLELRAEKKASEKAVDPQKAVEALGEIAGKIQEYTDKSSTWTEEDRAQWKSEYETLVQTIAVPALSFTSANLLTSTGVFFAILSALKYSGKGFEDIVTLAGGLPLLGDPLQNLLQNVDSSLGNVAIALLAVDILAPLTIPIAAGLTPLVGTWYKTRLESILDNLA
ncbi:hypothetical protein AAMO2058_001421400 [Amorphochlora amoebiformis]|uniref:Uncharacterized protein n=1 Tax=Amorphochlora amoebiformis TaxID=1561963 RepID=A0A7S0DIA3_9EUKA|mmetsp:Transcript_29305/g.46779  ORF Transcript_29305/g.46779 Transcript_29305/m.46779 type:complete len:217 (+) Transcript_29305:105-755(+)